MKYGSLFTGIGGFDLGFDRAGIACAWQVEQDNDCNRVLKKHWPKTKRGTDVREVTTQRFERPDVICGGFPCQDLSVAGKRAGLAGERSGLWSEFHRIIAEFAPGLVVIENVPGLLSGCGCLECRALGRIFRGHEIIRQQRFEATGEVIKPCLKCVAIREFLSAHSGRNMQIVLTGLVELGYHVAYGTFDSQFFGVPQRRNRVFIVGSLGNGRCAEILFESESLRGDSAPSRETGKRVADTVRGGTASGSNEPGNKVVGSLTPGAHPGSYNGQDAYTGHLIAHSLRAEGADASEDGTGKGTPLVAMPTMRARAPNRGAGHGARSGDNKDEYIVPVACFDERSVTSPDNRQSGNPERSQSLNGAGGQAIAFNATQDPISSEEYFGAISDQGAAIAFTERSRKEGRNFESQQELSFALTNPGSGGRTHARSIAQGMMVRRLTPRECERLQGFPDDWTRWDLEGKEISDSARYRMLGNAVTTTVSEWLGKRIVKFA